jgi:hypothetical protein
VPVHLLVVVTATVTALWMFRVHSRPGCCLQMSRDVEVMKLEMAKVMAMANVLDASNKQVGSGPAGSHNPVSMFL